MTSQTADRTHGSTRPEHHSVRPVSESAPSSVADTAHVEFESAYVDNRERVYRYLRGRTASDDEALDLTATTFERAWTAFHRRPTNPEDVTPWLLRIARNAAIDEGRRRRRALPAWLARRQDDLAGEDDQPEARALRADENREVRRFLRLLPELQRDAVVLRFGADLTAREIGSVLGRSEEAAQKLVSRGLARLKEAYHA